MTAKQGTAAAAELEGQFEREAATDAKRAEAAAISQARCARGEALPSAVEYGEPAPPALQSAPRVRESSRAKREAREAKQLRARFQRRSMADRELEAKHAAELAEQALSAHGIRHSFRPLPRVAFFASYMAGLDRNGQLALQSLREANMPALRREQVMRAAFHPQGFTPRRNVCTGDRADQQRYSFDGRVLQGPRGGRDWVEPGERDESHPGAIAVIQTALFIWLAKGRTRRKGYAFKLRGFGRGVFQSVTRLGKDAVFGHTRGCPGAMRALEQAGFVEYGQPPAEKVPELDRGPTGHAYNVFWLRSTPEELALEQEHDRLAELGRMGCLAALWSAGAEAAAELTEDQIPY